MFLPQLGRYAHLPFKPLKKNNGWRKIVLAETNKKYMITVEKEALE